ncbi:transporter [Methylocapsa acidiphila]|uniref:transporter n=1 Tax=Methylocapsa acidiphila TaxID=133552 RepID=UPI00047D2424|nr:transporter [Methylocapsa acidiphila]
MRVLRLARLCTCVLIAAFAGVKAASAGAWLMPPGEGQIIASTAFSGSTRAFDARGKLIPVPSYDKFELGAYLEYGVNDWLTVIAAPAYDQIKQPPPAASYAGLGESEIGARFGLYHSDNWAFSAQASLRTPGASLNDTLAPSQPKRAGGLDLRLMLGRTFDLAGLPAFAEVQTGYRVYAQNQPGEYRLDLTLGLRPLPQLLGLLQSFSSISKGSGGGFKHGSWHKLQPSLVYDLSPQWSVQLGGFVTVAGVNAGRELGPFAGLWYRF